MTLRAAPSSTATSAMTRPAGVSSRIRVTGSVTSTMPVSTSTVATPIVPWPHIGRQPDTSMNSTPKSQSGRVGGCRIAPDIAEWPRGSHINSVRSPSICVHEMDPPLGHGGAGNDPHSPDDDPGRHAFGVGVDRVQRSD